MVEYEVQKFLCQISNSRNMKNILIVGAGINGLTLGYKLKDNYNITIIEKENKIGGLARSFKYGSFSYDIGPHRFHTDDKQVLQFIKEVLKDDYTTLLRKSQVYLFEKYHDFPLRASSLFKLPIRIIFKSCVDLIFKKRYPQKNFTSFILNKYGKTLYNCFFKNYTEKFLKIPIEEVHIDWAITGLDRAIIDRKVKVGNLFELVKSSLMPKPIKTEFIYPKEGIYIFSDKLAKFIQNKGGKIITNSRIEKIDYSEGRINKVILNDGSIISPELVIWTAPLDELSSKLDIKNTGLAYLSLIIYNLEIDGEPKRDYQWCYYGEDNINFVRITNPYFFSKKNIPPRKTGLCIEFNCMEGDELWKNPEKVIEDIKKDLLKCKLIDKVDNLKKVHIEKIPSAYPIYRYDYKDNLNLLLEHFKKLENLILSGRCGKFWYNNMDHSIRDAFDTAQKIIKER